MHPSNLRTIIQTETIMRNSSFMLPLALIPKISHPALHHDPKRSSTPLWEPAVEVYEDTAQFVIRTELPGIDPEIIDIEIEDKSLLIKGSVGDRPSWENSFSKPHRESTAFTRLIALPACIEAEAAEFHHENGVLTVTLPKSRPSTMKSIKIQFEH